MAEQDSTNPPPAPTEPTTADAGQAKANTTDLSKQLKDQWSGAQGKVQGELKKLSIFEKLTGGGALLVIISSFLPAFAFSNLYYSISFNNLRGLGWVTFLAAIIVLLLVLLPKFNVKIPAIPFPMAQIHFVLAIVAAITSILQLFNFVFDNSPLAGPQYGIFLVVAGSALMCYSAYNERKPSHEATPPSTSTNT